MLPPSALASLISRYQAARAKTAELAAEVAQALALENFAGNGVPSPVAKRGRPAEADDEGEATPEARMDQVVAAVKRHGPIGTPGLTERIPGLPSSSARFYLRLGIANKLFVRASRGLYLFAGDPKALPAILKEGTSALRKGRERNSKARRFKGAVMPGSNPAKVLMLAEKSGGLVDTDMTRAAGLWYGNGDGDAASVILGDMVRRGQLVRIGRGKYATPTKAAELKKSGG